jgi:molybdenum cofactor synthesis domain-containing protein
VITLEEARRLMMRAVSRAGSEMVHIGEALGRVAASDITAPYNLPAESRSRLDGYALRSAETAAASDDQPVRIRLNAQTVSAGRVPTTRQEPGTCTRVMTGAVLPAGSDAVLAQEQAGLEGDHLVVTRPVRPASGLVEEGADALAGDVLAADGEVLTPTRLALAAAFGIDRVPVTIRPRVALLSTGDEVMEPGSPPKKGISYSNNRHLLAWLTEMQGGIPVHLGVSGDDPAEIAGHLDCAEADLVVTTGGTGRGDRDFVQEVWERLEVRKVFEGVLISPGRGTLGGLKEGRPFLALPGSPWGGRVIFEELIKPLLWRLQGFSCRWPVTIRAMLKERVDNRAGSCRVLTGDLELKEMTTTFSPSERKGVGTFEQVRSRFGYMILETHMLEMTAGSEVDVRLFDLPMLAAAVLGNGGKAGR